MVCSICDEKMYQPVSVNTILKGKVPNVSNRALQCPAGGHIFCVECWSNHFKFQIKDNNAHSLQCPSYKCGEILDKKWCKLLIGYIKALEGIFF